MKRLILTTVILSSLTFSQLTSAAQPGAALDSDSAVVSMNVALFASITNLDDFILTTDDTDGAAGTVYNGFDMFNLESNGQVRVELEGTALSNDDDDELTTSYSLNDDGLEFDTTADSVHNQEHKVSASAQLGDISSQLAGAYTGEITITVSAL